MIEKCMECINYEGNKGFGVICKEGLRKHKSLVFPLCPKYKKRSDLKNE